MIELNEDSLGPFEIVEEIGRGGMGIVYHAISPEGDDVALKICATDDEYSIKRFKREVRAIQKIKHENVMPVLFADLDNTPPYYTMPLAYTSVNDIVADLSKDHDKLDENLCDYKTIYSQIGRDQLHLQIQRIWEKADGLHNAEVE